MILSFDKFERYELPQVTLCNPNSRATEVDGKITITDTVGVLSNPKGMNLKLNFNAPHELSFDYYRHKSTDPIKQSFYDKIYEAIQTDRYIYLTDIGYFTISGVTDSDEDNIDKKSITVKSCEENELATAEGLHLKEGTYYLHTDKNDGLLDLFLPKTAGWTIGFVDPSLLTKPYFVEETEVDNGYNFLYTTVQDMFECIVEPDIIKRTISVYSRVYYAEHHLTDIHIAKYNLLKHKTVEENDEDKYTALNVQGKDENLEIRTVNPTGKNVIYNFEPRYAWMSPALQAAVERWQKKCESVEEEYLTLQQGYYTELEKLFNEEQNIEVLKGELKILEETRDAVIITVGDQQSTALSNVNTQIANKQNEINKTTSTYNIHKSTVCTNYENPIHQINKDCALDTTAVDINGKPIFTVDLLNELMTHVKPTDYTDEYMLVTESMTYPQRFEKAKELMDRTQSQLVKISSGQKTYSIDTRSFLFNKQFRHFSEQLCAGAIIYVETKNDIMEQLHLTSIDINFDEKSTNFTLGNKYDRSDLKALYEDALGQNSKSFSELKYIASIIEDQQKQLDYQRNWVADLRTLTLDNVLTSEDQAIEINNRGLIGRKRRLDKNGEWDFDENGNPYFEDEQVKLINNTLVFTEDNWNTASTAVGKIAVGYDSKGNVKYTYGINGQVLIGELILGNNLVLTGTGAGIKIKDGNGKDAFYADNDGKLVLSGKITAKSGKIANWKIFDNYLGSDWGGVDTTTFLSLTGAEATFYTSADLKSTKREPCVIYNKGKFAVTTDGTLYAQNANISGIINATSGKVGGWEIKQYTLGNASISGLRERCAVGIAPNIDTTTMKILETDTYDGETKGLCFWAGAKYSEGCNEGYGGYVKLSAAPFRVYGNGALYASKGKIGAWTMDSSKLWKSVVWNGGLSEYGTGMSATSNADDPAFYAGFAGNGGHPWNHAINTTNPNESTDWKTYTKFYVLNDGTLHASKAEISGTIKAGTIIGTLTSDKLGGVECTSDGKLFIIKTPKLGKDSSPMAQLQLGEKNKMGYFLVRTSPTSDLNRNASEIKMEDDKIVLSCETNWITIKGEQGEFHGNWQIGGRLVSNMSENGYLNLNNTNKDDGSYAGTVLTGGNWNNRLAIDKSQGTLAGTWSASECLASGSDSNIKNSIEEISENYSILFDNLKPVRYKYNHGTSNRYHTGFIAQDVEQGLLDAGLTTSEFASFIRNENGECSLRYEEFIALNTLEIQKLKARVAELETQIQTLTAG